ncbi:MAG: hypothetical protein LBS67_03745 [Clostridiales Family XIII bacterium]|jgi:hypothetical protein|nr:hypothetical protein [Clostridiales Family XIII bacterium]
MGKNDTALVRMVIADIAEKYGWGYRSAMDRFYNSKVCMLMSDEETGVFTYAPHEVVELFDETEMS